MFDSCYSIILDESESSATAERAPVSNLKRRVVSGLGYSGWSTELPKHPEYS